MIPRQYEEEERGLYFHRQEEMEGRVSVRWAALVGAGPGVSAEVSGGRALKECEVRNTKLGTNMSICLE